MVGDIGNNNVENLCPVSCGMTLGGYEAQVRRR